MDLKASPQKPDLSFSDCTSDPEEKEISEGEDEDDDRNHKHRKRETGSQSLEADIFDQVLTRPYRKRKAFENGHPSREGHPQSGETWKNYSSTSERDFASRFEKRRANRTSFSRASQDLNQRTSGNQSLSVESMPVRGRGMERLSWGMHNSRIGFVDVASQMIQSGPVPSGVFGGTGMPNISNTHSTPWNTFGLVPGIPNGGLDGLHPFGLQGTLRPPITPGMNIGIPRQRCRDFEERGFCLRGDLCPMEHGINRIVIEDVQSLSQFNLPVSLPGSQLPGTSRNGTLPVISTLVKNKAFHSTSRNLGPAEDGLNLNGDLMPGGSDVYDPDQPLWTNDNIITPPALLEANESNTGVKESVLDIDPSGQKYIESCEENNGLPVTSAATAVSQSFSGWGKVTTSKNRLGQKETSSDSLEHQIKSEDTPNAGLRYVPQHGIRMNIDGNGPQVREFPLKQHRNSVSNVRKPSQKALRTLFVNGIPLKDNKKDALLSHFQKFGELIDIYIPMNSERAFVQFLKREEAEAALTSPDAVMGNRFIKLLWANRDNTNDFGSTATNVKPITHRKTLNPALFQPSVPDSGNENPHFIGNKDDNIHPSIVQVPIYDRLKPMVANISKNPPVQQKKLDNLERLKEELRKKQEMLDQKRNEFRLQLDKLEKQSVGFKDTTVSDQVTKSLEGDTATGQAKTETTNSSSLGDDVITEIAKSSDLVLSHTTTSKPSLDVQLSSMRPLARPLAPLGAHFVGNRFKLDNRPTTFKTVSPLPAGLANVATLKAHFSIYGDLSSVELEEPELQETNDTSLLTGVSAQISFTTRRSAEKAFSSGKCWQGHNLQFMWLTLANSGRESDGSGNLTNSSNMPSNANVQPGIKAATPESQKNDVIGSGEPEHLAGESETESMGKSKDSEQPSTSVSSKNDVS